MVHEELLNRLKKEEKAKEESEFRKRKSCELDMEDGPIRRFFPSKTKTLPIAPESDQKRAQMLLAIWVSKLLRPFSIVEDNGLRAFVNYCCSSQKQLIMPSRNTLKRNLCSLGYSLQF